MRICKKIPKFYSAKYFSQYPNSSTTDKLVNSYSNFLTVIHIRYNGENGDALLCLLEILKFQNLKAVKNPETLRSLEFVIYQNLKHDAVTVSNLFRN